MYFRPKEPTFAITCPGQVMIHLPHILHKPGLVQMYSVLIILNLSEPFVFIIFNFYFTVYLYYYMKTTEKGEYFMTAQKSDFFEINFVYH